MEDIVDVQNVHMTPDLTLITNSLTAGQPSMVNYGQVLFDEMSKSSLNVVEIRGRSSFAKMSRQNPSSKVSRDLDRFLASPVHSSGRRTRIVHAVDPGNSIYFPLIRSGARVITIHDMIPYLAHEGTLRGFEPSFLGKRIMSLMLQQFKRADLIVTCSNATRKDFLRITGIDPNKVATIYNCRTNELERADPASCATFRLRNAIPSGVPLIAHIGRGFYKNHKGVLKVFRLLKNRSPEAHLVLVTDLTPSIAELIRNYGLAEAVTLIPYLDPRDLSAFYSSASALLFPSLYEGFGVPVIEAQACGVAVVCSNSGALAEVSGQSAFLHDVDDEEGLASSLEHAIHNSPEANVRIKTGLLNIDRFDRPIFAAAYERCYRVFI